jgi:hypothetical protein
LPSDDQGVLWLPYDDSGAWRDQLAKELAVTTEGICEIHRRFCAELPEALLWVEDPEGKERVRVVPGELRRRDVKAGGHVAISPGDVLRFLGRFEDVYGRLGKTDSILAAAPAHHRLVWIHPFVDGNGRVARLMSHAALLEALDTGAVWSVARGLARNVEAYKRHLAACDAPRRNDLDGRGNLSEEALAAFTEFFLKTCFDQVSFMESLLQPDRLRARILLWAEEEVKLKNLPPRSGRVLEPLLYRGELPRAEVANAVGVVERHARRVVCPRLLTVPSSLRTARVHHYGLFPLRRLRRAGCQAYYPNARSWSSHKRRAEPQKCLVHLMRDVNDNLSKQPFNEEMKEIARRFASLLKPIIETVDRFGLKARYLRRHIRSVEQFYDALYKQTFETEVAVGYKKRFEKNRNKRFTFLDQDGVPWNNNNAEHAIKALMKLRRSIGGQSSLGGMRDYLIILCSSAFPNVSGQRVEFPRLSEVGAD